MKICSTCGFENQDNDTFCQNCFTTFEKEVKNIENEKEILYEDVSSTSPKVSKPEQAENDASSSSIVCPLCFSKVAEGNDVCPNCGGNLRKEKQKPSVPSYSEKTDILAEPKKTNEQSDANKINETTMVIITVVVSVLVVAAVIGAILMNRNNQQGYKPEEDYYSSTSNNNYYNTDYYDTEYHDTTEYTTEPIDDYDHKIPYELRDYEYYLEEENRNYIVDINHEGWNIKYRSTPERYPIEDNTLGRIQHGTKIYVEYIYDDAWVVIKMGGRYVFASIYENPDSPDESERMLFVCD